MSCQHECVRPPAFPAKIFNRPALDSIGYRIGMYAEMRDYLLDQINKRPELSGWTHRQADDPGIAILEAGAIVADILTFYQDLYANEAFLRSAKWQESVFDLVRLTGYRPAPGVGGIATFAVTAKGDYAITVPKGFGFKVKLEGADKQAEFETTEDAVAYPHLGLFSLYRPRLSPGNIDPAVAGNQLELAAINGSTISAELAAVEIEPGDRVMLAPPAQMWDVTGTAYSTQDRAEILVVKQVERLLDRTLITFEGTLTQVRGPQVDAYIIDRTFRHFGHNAPPQTTTLSGNPPVASFLPTRFRREVWGTDAPSSAETGYYSRLFSEEMPLDREVDDLASGGTMICEATVDFDGQATPVPLVVVRTIAETRSDTLTWGNTSGPTTVVTLDRRLVANDDLWNEAGDIRRMRFHEAVSARLTLRAPTQWTSGGFPDTRLNYFGTLEQARALKGRQLALQAPDGRYQELKVVDDLPSLANTFDPGPKMWEVELDRLPEFTREDFDESRPAIAVYGNLVPTTQGKTQPEVPIGSGDSRQEFQTMPLGKSPLTYLVDGASTPPQVPELTVRVDGVQWRRVDTLFGAGPDDRVYVVREDRKGASQVQFGDGEMGSVLPSGRNNVVATYRTGIGATGEAAEEPKAGGRLTGLEKVYLPSAVAGGAQPETDATARIAAPGRMQSLGRLVGLADYEAEALTIPGVVKSLAVWMAPGGIPRIGIVVLTESGSDADVEFVRETMATYNRCKGPSRFPIEVIAGVRRFVHIALTVGYDPARRPQDIEAAVRTALIDDLFGLANRAFGQSAHKSQVIGAVQQVDGVRWVLADPVQLICALDQVLALHPGHLELNLVADTRAEACS